jgi:hypothetical protein
MLLGPKLQWLGNLSSQRTDDWEDLNYINQCINTQRRERVKSSRGEASHGETEGVRAHFTSAGNSLS